MKVRKAGAFVDLGAGGDALVAHGDVSGSGSTARTLADTGTLGGAAALELINTINYVKLPDTTSYVEKTFVVAAGTVATVTICALRDATVRQFSVKINGVTVAATVSISGANGDQVAAFTTDVLPPGTYTIRCTGVTLTPRIGAFDVTTTLAYDPGAGNVHSARMTGNVTIALGASAASVATMRLVMKQDGTGGRVITWPSSVSWVGGTPNPSKAANSYEIYELTTTDSGVTWVGALLTGADDVTQVELDAVVAALSVIGSNNQTGTTYTLALADAGKVIELNNAAAITLTIPTNATAAFPIGTVIELWQQGAGQVTVAPAGGVTVRSPGGLTKLYGQYSGGTLRKRATDEWVLQGDLA